MDSHFHCSKCGKIYPLDTLVLLCSCKGLLDLSEGSSQFFYNAILQEERSLFRYIKSFPFQEAFQQFQEISLGEGLTPIVPLDKENPNLLLKLDYLMPTLSFKDRGAALLIGRARFLGVEKVFVDSSGNAGVSMAAYASRAGMECTVYLPSTTSKGKVKQIQAYGAVVHSMKGTREEVAALAWEAVEKGEGYYASHVYDPFFYQGTKTYIYEVFEELKGDLPEVFMIPVGNGTLLLGSYYGLLDLYQAGLIKRLPRLLGVQVEGYSPIYHSFKGEESFGEEGLRKTIAEGIAISKPRRAPQIEEAIRVTRGDMILAKEEKILTAQKYLARKGFFVEPTSAVTLAGFFDYQGIKRDERVLIPLTGAGVKAT